MTQPTLIDQDGAPVVPSASQPLVTTDELLRVGMSGGRALVEPPKRPRKPKDTATPSMFDTISLF